MKTLAMVACFLSAVSLSAFDFGGNIDEAFVYNTSGSIGVINSLKTTIYTTLGRPAGTFFSARLSYLGQLFGAAETPPDPVAFPFMFDIEELKFAFGYPSGRVVIGRYLLAEPTRAIFAHKVDGVSLRHSFAPFALKLDFGYTGLLWKTTSAVIPSLVDLHYSQADDAILGSPRLIGVVSLDTVPIFNQTLRIGALVQEDLRNQSALIEEGETEKQPGLGGSLDTQYLYAHVGGPILPILYYSAYGVYGLGRSLSYIDGAYEYSSISSFMTGVGIQLYLREVYLSLLQLRGALASGDADATGFRESNTSGNLSTFVSLTGLPTGLVFGPNPGNIAFAEFSYSFRPLANSGLALLSTLQVVGKALAFFRTSTGPISEPGIPADVNEQYLGMELDVTANSRPFSDLGFSLTGGVFFPSAAFSVDGSAEAPRFTVRATVSMSL